MTLIASSTTRNVFVVLPLAEWAAQLKADIEAFLTENHNNRNTAPVTQEQSLVFVRAILEDVLNRRLLWLPPAERRRSRLDEALMQFYDHWTADMSDPQCEHLFVSAFDPIELRISNRLDMFIPEATWNVWYTKAFGQDLLLEQGTDYRIADWTRRMETKEWS